MGFTASNPVTVDNATKKDDYDDVFDNTVALKETRSELLLGGDYNAAVDDTSFTDVPGAIHVEIDGTNFSGLTVEIHVMCLVAAGTGTFDLYNITDAGAVASSETTFTNTTADRAESSTITLATASKEYKLRVKGAAAADLPRVWGAKIVIR
jgi:hypothetical protein